MYTSNENTVNFSDTHFFSIRSRYNGLNSSRSHLTMASEAVSRLVEQRRERKRRQRDQLKKRRELRRLRKRNKQNKEKEVIGTKSSSQEAIGTVSASSKGDEKHHLKVRSVQEPSILLTPIKSIPKKSSHSQCRVKLIDDCSWPHCNRSCPKLKNPKTGKYQQTSTNSLIRRF